MLFKSACFPSKGIKFCTIYFSEHQGTLGCNLAGVQRKGVMVAKWQAHLLADQVPLVDFASGQNF